MCNKSQIDIHYFQLLQKLLPEKRNNYYLYIINVDIVDTALI